MLVLPKYLSTETRHLQTVLKLPYPWWSCSRTSISNSYEQETNNPLEINSQYIETSISSNIQNSSNILGACTR